MSGNVPEHLLISRATEPSEPVARSADSESAMRIPEWFDAHRWLPFVLLAAIPFLVTLPLWIYHLSADPIWFFSGVVKDVKQGVNTVGLPFGDPNVGWTSEALGHLAAWQWIHGEIPWWNSYSGIGLPLAGEMQPGAFFLPFIFLLLLHHSFVWLRVAMQLVAGFSTFALGRELGLGRLAALIGGILFELNGTFAFTPGPDSVFCAAAFLPLLLLGIEQVSKRERERTGSLWIALGIAFSLLAGFPEVAYIDGLLALLWAACRFATLDNRWRLAMRVAWGGLLGLLLSAPLLTAFSTLVRRSSAFASHQTGAWSLSSPSIPSIFVPYIYGPFPSASAVAGRFNVWGVSSYAGILIIFFALVGLQARKPLWLRVMLAAWVALAWAKTFGVKPVMTAMNHIPFLLQTAFYQYSPPSWTFCLIILAAFGIEELRHRNPRFSLAVVFTFIALAVSIHLAWPWRHFWHSQPADIAQMSGFFIFGLGWALAGLVCVGFLLLGWRGEKGRLAIAAIVAFNAVIFFCIPMLSAVRPGSVDVSAIRFLKTHVGLSRFYTLGPIQPNYGAYFQIASIDYDGFPIPESFTKFVTERLFPPLPNTGNEIFCPSAGSYDPGAGLNYLYKFLPAYEALGVKYVVGSSGTMQTLAPQAQVPTSGEDAEPLVLWPGGQTEFTVSIPPNPAGSVALIRGVSILIGNYGHAADGNLQVRICARGACTEGSRPLSESADNSPFYISLSDPMSIVPDTPVTLTVAHMAGGKPVALWVWPDLPGQNQHLVGPDGKAMPGRAVRVSFGYDTGSAVVPRVYHDSLMDIFELPHPVPYFSIERGGPCRLNPTGRDSLHTVCDAPALLIRRELYMPGWRALLHGSRQDAKPYADLFQSFDLPRGDSHLRFDYTPPYAALAGCSSLFAFALIIAEIAFAFRRRRSRIAKEVTAQSTRV